MSTRTIALAACALLLACVVSAAEPPPYVMFQNKDLNGDGKREAIRLVADKQKRGAYILTVNGQQLRDRCSDHVSGFRIIDIDRRDRYKEVAVYSHSDGDYNYTALYWYDGTHLHRVGGVGDLTVLGNGTVIDGQWMGFWEREQKCVLDRQHRLRDIAQALYKVDKGGMTLAPFKLYKSRDYKRVAVTVPRGTWVRVLYCDCRGDHRNWNYLVRTDRGVRGWTRRGVDNIDLPRAA